MSVGGLTSAALTLLVFCFPMALQERARGENNQQQALVDIEHRWLEAEDNPSALELILADDFVHVLPFGFVMKAEQLRYMRTHPAPERGNARRFEDLRVRLFGSVGIVNGIVVATTPDGRVRKTIFTDVFAYRDGKWQAVNAQESRFSESAHP